MVLKLKKSFLYEIQGLRAIAVLLVLIYHIQPSLIPGGYEVKEAANLMQNFYEKLEIN